MSIEVANKPFKKDREEGKADTTMSRCPTWRKSNIILLPSPNIMILQGWREVVEAVFPEEADRRRQVVRFREGSREAERERKVRK